MTSSERTPRQYAIIEAPSVLGLKPTGVDCLPDALLREGLADRLKARRAARLMPPPFSAEPDSQTQILNASAIASWTPQLADTVEAVLDAGEFPLVLGGDCSILLGPALALKRRGRFGLLFIDGHADFYQAEANPTGEAASMDLALAAGYGPALLCDLEGRGPLVRSGDVVAFGFRDEDEQGEYGSQPLPADVLALDLRSVRRMGASAAARAAMARLSHGALDGFFIHLDADSLHDDVMPAVDYRLPDGLTIDEMREILEMAVSGTRAVGMEVTIYNPALDNDGRAARALVNLLVAALA